MCGAHTTFFTLGLSTRALKTDSLDPDPQSGFNVAARALHTARRLRALYCLTRSHALSRSTAHSSDPDRDCVEGKWSLNSDPGSASDPDPRSRVESPIVELTQNKTICTNVCTHTQNFTAVYIALQY